jgi:hypothetical protein
MPRRKKEAAEDLQGESATATMEPGTDSDTTNSNCSITPEMSETQTPEAEVKQEVVKHERLTGQEMLAALNQLGQDAEQEEAFRAAGYYSEVYENGELVKIRYQEKAFWAAFAAASQGITFATKTRGGGAGRPKRPYVTVSKESLRLVLGGHFAEAAGFTEKQKIKVTAEAGVITLTPWDDAEESDEMDDEDL